MEIDFEGERADYQRQEEEEKRRQEQDRQWSRIWREYWKAWGSAGEGKALEKGDTNGSR